MKFCAVAGCSQFAADPRFARNADGVRHRDTLVPLLAATIKSRSKRDWLNALEAAKVPCGAINDMAEVFADPQVQARAMAIETEHPLAGAVPLVASPIKTSTDAARYRRAPPLLGQHTDEVLAEFGVDDDERAARAI